MSDIPRYAGNAILETQNSKIYPGEHVHRLPRVSLALVYS